MSKNSFFIQSFYLIPIKGGSHMCQRTSFFERADWLWGGVGCGIWCHNELVGVRETAWDLINYQTFTFCRFWEKVGPFSEKICKMFLKNCGNGLWSESKFSFGGSHNLHIFKVKWVFGQESDPCFLVILIAGHFLGDFMTCIIFTIYYISTIVTFPTMTLSKY